MQNLRLITFDVTNTLLKFRKPPVQQYIEFGAKHNVIVSEENMKKAFKQQWTELNESMPHYGLCWRSWWTQFVIKSFQNSKPESDTSEDTLRTIASELIEHFTTAECWEVKEGAMELLLAVKHLDSSESRARTQTQYDGSGGKNGGNMELSGISRTLSVQEAPIQIGVVSNFDPRLEQILRATQLYNFFNFFLTSHECQVSKPHQGIFNAALLAATKNHSDSTTTTTTTTTLRRELPIQPGEALHIGDSYNLDFVGAVNSGWNAILVVSPHEQKNIPSHILNSNPPVVFPDLIQLKSYLDSSQCKMYAG